MDGLEELKEELREKLNLWRQIFTEAKTADDSGDEIHDFTRVECLGTAVNQLEGAEKVHRVKEFADALKGDIDRLEIEVATEEAVADFKGSEKALKAQRKRLPKPGPLPQAIKDRGRSLSFKQISNRIVDDPVYKNWQRGSKDGRIEVDASFMEAKTLMSTTAGFPPEVTRNGVMVDIPIRPNQLIDVIPRGTTSQGSLEYMSQTTRTEGAVEISEGASKPEATYVWAAVTEPVQEIAHSIPVTDTMLDDAPFMASIIEGQLREGVSERLDGQALAGDGTAPNLSGILDRAGLLTINGTGIDIPTVVRQGISAIRTGAARAVATHVFMHPDDWTTTSTLQNAAGDYIFGMPGEMVAPRVWSLPVIENEELTQGTVLIGSMLSTNIQLVERQGIFVERGFSGDDFVQNRQHIKAWGRWAVAVYRPAAFLTVTNFGA